MSESTDPKRSVFDSDGLHVPLPMCGDCVHLDRAPGHEGGICTMNTEQDTSDFVIGLVRWMSDTACRSIKLEEM